jgi:hypothetical protein
MPATVAALCEVLAPAFSEQRVRTCRRRMREAGLLPVGRDGNAEIRPSHAALALIVMGLDHDGDSIAAVTEAQRIAAFKVVAVDSMRGSTTTRRRIRSNGITLLYPHCRGIGIERERRLRTERLGHCGRRGQPGAA